MNLSPNFTLEEAVISQTATRDGIDNTPPPSVLDAMKLTAFHMEDVRHLLDHSLHIDSWFRSVELNRALRSRDTSQHIRGEAVDFICPAFGSPLEICRTIIQSREHINWDELILEHTWVHISFCSSTNNKPRNKVISLLESGGYANGLTNIKGIPL